MRTKFFLIFLLVSLSSLCPAQTNLHILIVTGGHDFNETAFFAMFNRMEGIDFAHAVYGQGAEQKLTPEAAKEFDAIVFYDMHQEKDPQSEGILRLLAKGKGMVFLHHSIWSYDGTWPDYREILGGRASSKEKVVADDPSPTSTTKDDQHSHIRIADPKSPIVEGVHDFDIVDETYNHYWVSPKVRPLLTNDNPTSEPLIAWTHTYKKSRIVYIELGHGPSAYENPNYQTLVRQSIQWVVGDKVRGKKHK